METSNMKLGVYIIHSSAAKDRLKNVDALRAFFSISTNALTNVIIKVIEGVYTNVPYDDSRFDDGQKLTKGVVGCALAHVNAMRQALEDNVTHAMIFEDDVGICCDSASALFEWLDRLEKEIHDWNVCMMYYISPFVGTGHDGTRHTSHVESSFFRIMTCPFGTQAYCVKKETLLRLVQIQDDYMKKGKLAIADGLFIHGTQENGKPLKLVGPTYNEMFFIHLEVPSLIGSH
ncbi:MAG: hypothetical protein EBY22_08465 [Gammaproteobacteria bacterium]|nr:hypothetical protein [Gammaproteobacteria bacterium]